MVLGEDHCSLAEVEHILFDMTLRKAALAPQTAAREVRRRLGRKPVLASKRHREGALSDSFVVLSCEGCRRSFGLGCC